MPVIVQGGCENEVLGKDLPNIARDQEIDECLHICIYGPALFDRGHYGCKVVISKHLSRRGSGLAVRKVGSDERMR